MNYLLDTHALLWSLVAPASLSAAAARIMTDGGSILLVSAASAWEIATKVRNGKLPEAVALEPRFLQTMDEIGVVVIPIDGDTALRAGRLGGEHKDPFDRLIAAQAIALDIAVISKDEKFDLFGVRRIW